ETSAAARSERQVRKALMDAALAFFRGEVEKSSTAKAYCAGRGIDAATIGTWELGYAPDVGEALVAYLKREGHPLSEAKTLFLVDGDTDRGYSDKFVGRLIFPIRNERGDVVAFGGRLLGDGVPKYINSSDTPLYRKSHVLYGLWQARETLRKSRRAILAEGYLDVIACHRAGVTGALASLGTSLAEDQAKLLKHWCDAVTILYDGDAAGLKAADRAADILAAEGLIVDVATLPAGDDPDTLLQRDGPAGVERAAAATQSPLDFRVAQLERRLETTDPAFWVELYDLLANAPTELELMRQVERLAPLYPELRDVVAARKALRTEVMRRRRPAKAQAAKGQAGVAGSPRRAGLAIDSAELALLCAYLFGERRAEYHALIGDAQLFVTGAAARIAAAISDAFPEGPPDGPPAHWLDRLDPEIVSQISELDSDRLGALNEKFVGDAVARLQRQKADRLSRAEAVGDDDPLSKSEKAKERLERLKPDERNS
ncbi:MAG TPA: toprim domain-containing protein, partial [Fimbriimonadaceae bacterium]|nr:toprim domain-containing protein [Fimbriimonadaceae bacterium]